jgi:hypothetical protein
MLLQWLWRLKGVTRTAHNQPRCPRRPRPVPLGLEALEARAVPATTLTWTGQGGDNLWSDAANWTHTGGPDKTPGAGDNLVFPDGTGQLGNRNDLAGLALGSISLTGAGYDISGNGISLSGGIATGSITGQDTVEVPITATQAQNVTVPAGLTLALTGGVTCASALTLDSGGTVELGGSSSITGQLTVLTGTLTVEHGATLTDAGTVTVGGKVGGGSLDDHGQVTVAAAATGRPAGTLSLHGALTVEADGSLTDAGSVSVGLKGSLDDRGGVSVRGTGTLDDTTALTVESGAALTDAGALTVEHGAVLTDAGSVTVTKASFTGPRATVDDHGQITVAAGANGQGGGSMLLRGATLTVESDGTLADAGNVTVGPKGSLDDLGSVSVETTGTLDDATAVKVESGATLSDAGALTVVNQATLADAGALAITGPGSLEDDGSVSVTSTGTLDDGHSLTVKLGATLDDGHTLTVEPLATLDDGGTMTVDSAASLGMHGTLQIEASRTLDVSGTAVLAGTSQQPAILAASPTNAAIPVISLHSGATLALDATTGTTELNLPGVPGFAPTPGQQFALVANTTGQPVTGLLSAGGVLLREGDTVRAGQYDFTISYRGGTGNDVVLTYAGLHRFDVTITDSLSTPVTVDGTDLPLSGGVGLVAGVHTLADKNNPTVTVPFTVGADGTVGYVSALEGILTGAASQTLGVHGVPVTVDSTAIAPLASTVSVDGSLYPTGSAGTFRLLPGPFAVAYAANGATTTLSFAVSAQDQVTFNPSDPSQDALARVEGGNGVVLLAPAAQAFPVTINSSLRLHLAATYTLNGQTAVVGVQTFDLPAGQYVIEYQLPDPNGPGGLRTYTPTFTVMTDGTLTAPAGKIGLHVVNGVVTLLPP